MRVKSSKKNEILLANENYIRSRLGFSSFSQCLNYPKFIELETIRACNARCTFCAITNWESAEVGILSDDLFAKFVKEMESNNQSVDTVCLCRDGEPLLDKKLPARIRQLKDVGVKKINISTNAQLLTEDLGEKLVEAGLDEIMFSIDGHSKEVFESIRKNLSFEVVVRNTRNFIKLRNQLRSNMRLRIRMVVTEMNAHEASAWKEYWMPQVRQNDIVQAKPVHSWGNQLFQENKAKKKLYSNKPCIAPFNMLVIHYNGNVVLCGHDFLERIVVGNFNEETINQIWQGERFQEVRAKHLLNERDCYDMCQGCDIWDRGEIKK